jgi:hypothetical protein
VSIPLGEEISQTTGAVRAGVVSKELYEIGYVELISCEGLLDGPSVSPHPLKEFSDDSNRLRCICRRNTTAFAEMTHKNPNARDNLAGAILRCSRTATARTMPRERSHGPVVDLLDVETFMLEPDAEVREAVKMESCHDGVVPSPDELTFVVVE